MKDDGQKDVLQRLRSIEGHVCGVTRMIEDGVDCPAVLRQIMALQGALDKVSQILMGDHLAACIPGDLKRDARKDLERALADVSSLLLVTRRA